MKSRGNAVTEDAEPLVYRFGGDIEDLSVIDLIPRVNLMSVKMFAREFGIKRKIVSRVIEGAEIEPAKKMKIGGVKVPVFRLRDVIPLLFKGEFPKIKRGRPRKDADIDGESDQARLLRARADHAELDLAEAMGTVHHESDIIHDVGDMLAAFRAKLLNLPVKVSAVVPVDIRQEVEATFRKGINEALSELSQYRPKLHRKSGANGGAPVRTDRESVGGSLPQAE